MKRYILILTLSECGLKESHLVNIPIQELVNSTNAPILKKNYLTDLMCLSKADIYVTVVNGCDQHHSQWIEYESFMEMSDSFLSESLCPAADDCKRYDASAVANGVLSLADSLPSQGSCFVDVLIPVISYSVLSDLQENMNLLGALMRLHLWNTASIKLLCDDITIDTDNWFNLLHASNETIEIGHEIWRGFCYDSNCNESCHPDMFSIHLNQVNNEKISVYRRLENNDLKISANVVDRVLRVIGQYSYDTIPDYAICSTLQLSLHNIGGGNGNSGQSFIKYLNSSSNVCTLVAFQYTAEESSHKSLTTYRWMECVSKKDYRSLHTEPLKDTDKHSWKTVHLLLMSDGICTSTNIQACLLHDPVNLCAFFMDRMSVQVSYPSEDSYNKMVRCLSTLPYFHGESLPIIEELISSIEKDVLREWKAKFKVDDNPHNGFVEEEAICKHIKEEVLSKLNLRSRLARTKIRINIPDEDEQQNQVFEHQIDPNDWPERRFMLLKETDENECKNSESSKSLISKQRPATHSTTLSLDANEFLKHFHKTGEARKSIQMKSVSLSPKTTKKRKCPINDPSSQTSSPSWPSVIHKNCHDTYFNANLSSEEQENVCDRLKDQCVKNETATTCSNVNAKNVTNYMKLSIDGNRKSVAASTKPKSTKCTRTTPRKHSRKSVNNHILTSSNHRNIRRSPRKKVAHVRSTMTNNSCLTSRSVDDLSDAHRKKLRCCVADSLEQNGISLEHYAFMSCGKKLFAVCKPFIKDVVGTGSTSAEMKKICDAHVKQVIEFELKRLKKRAVIS